VEIVRSASDTGAIVGSLILPKYQAFKANKDSTAFFFYNLEEATFSVNELDVDGITPINYTTGSVAIREGFLRTNSFVIDGSNPTQKFTLRYKNIDTQTISIAVQNSTSNATGSDAAWTESQNITLINGESNVFFLEEGPDEYYRIYFGDGILGKRLNEGNLVTITFLESSGIEANDIGFTDAESNRVFNSLDSVDTVKVVLPSFGGSEKETTNSIKYNAPKNFTTQERAVTASDYSIILQKDFAFIKSIKCWGGEENDPPAYGKVFICIKPENRAALTSSEKNAILKSLTKNRGVVGVVPELVDPNIIYLIINCDAKVDIVKNKGSITQLNAKIIKAIDDYIITNLDIFDADLIANELEASILDMDSSILSVTITPQLEYRLIPEYGAARSYTVKFQNAIQRSNSIDVPNIQSNSFTYLDYKNVVRVCKLYDDGFGLIYIGYEQDGLSYSIGRFDNLDLSVFSPESIGTIDYETGEMNLVKFNPIYSAENNTIKIFANVVDSDIFVNPNTILSIDTNDRNATVINLIESAFRKPIR
jgi:hypothetical protein